MSHSEANETACTDSSRETRVCVPPLRLAGLFSLFFFISFGLGYPTLNRYNPRQVAGLSDVKSYAALIVGSSAVPGEPHVRYRVLVPCVARLFYRLANGRSGSWDPVSFGLLVADSLFVAGTAVLIIVVGLHQLGDFAVSLVASLLYLVNFCVPNLRLAGLVDAGEAFFLLALLWILSERKLWLLPAILVLGALTKETFVPLSFAFLASWWIVTRRTSPSSLRGFIWIVASCLIGTFSLSVVQWYITGRFLSPIEFAASLHRNHEYVRHFASSFLDREFWYIFFWLLPIGLPRLKCLPRSWLVPTAATVAMVFILEDYYGGGGATIGRALFSVTGPVLALSSSLFLLETSKPRPVVHCSDEVAEVGGR